MNLSLARAVPPAFDPMSWNGAHLATIRAPKSVEGRTMRVRVAHGAATYTRLDSPTLDAAQAAARQMSRDAQGVAHGVLQAQDGAYYVTPLGWQPFEQSAQRDASLADAKSGTVISFMHPDLRAVAGPTSSVRLDAPDQVPASFEEGRVKFFEGTKGYGFISAGGEDLFVHYSNIETGPAPRTLVEGQRVAFQRTPGIKGEEAANVQELDTRPLTFFED